jgi:hypothetical protein
MVSIQRIVKQIREDWPDERRANICIDVLNFLLRVPAKNILHITFGSLKQVITNEFEDSELLMAVQYLSGDRTPLLEIGFEFIENDEIYPLSNLDVKIARQTGELVHPDTGELIDDFEDKTFIYFMPGRLVKEIEHSNV